MSLLSVFLHDNRTDLALVKAGVMDVILRGNPANINMSRVLTREDPHAIEVFIHQLEAFTVKHLFFPGLLRDGLLCWETSQFKCLYQMHIVTFSKYIASIL